MSYNNVFTECVDIIIAINVAEHVCILKIYRKEKFANTERK